MSDVLTKLFTFLIIFVLVLTIFCFGDSTTSTELSLDNVNKGEFIASIFISFVATCFVWETILEDYSKYVDKD